MQKGILSTIVAIIIAAGMIHSAAAFDAKDGVPLEPTGACYVAGGLGCKDKQTQKTCEADEVNKLHFNYFHAGNACNANGFLITHSSDEENCLDATKLPALEQACHKALNTQIELEKSGKAAMPYCRKGEFRVVAPVKTTALFIRKDYKLCLANCAAVVECVVAEAEPVDPVPPAPPPSPAPPSLPTLEYADWADVVSTPLPPPAA